MSALSPTDKQGGKAFGQIMTKFEAQLDEINKSFLEDGDYDEVEDLEFKLNEFKNKFIECDRDKTGDLSVMDVKYMLEKLGMAKTHREVLKIIREVDSQNQQSITYTDFVRMMIGPKQSVLKMILLFEGLGKPAEKPTGVAPKRNLDSLP